MTARVFLDRQSPVGYIIFCKKRPACDYLANRTLLKLLQWATPSSTLIYLPYAAHPCRQTRDSGIGHRP